MNVLLAIVFYVLAAWMAFGVIAGPFLIGKPRKPWTAGGIVLATVTGAFVVAGLIIAGITMWGAA